MLTVVLPSPISENPSIRSFSQLVGELLLVAPVCRAEDAEERVRIRPFDLLHGLLQRGTNVGRDFSDVVPVTAFREHEAVHLRKEGWVGFAVNLARLSRFLVPDIGDAFEEKQRENVALPIGANRPRNREVDPSRKSGGALHRLHCFCLEFDGACEVQRRVPTDWVIEPIDVSGYGSFSLAS